MMLVVICITALAQAKESVDSTTNLNTVMRSNNKIYVVMAVCLTILFGLIIYLIRIDRKISKAEAV